MKISSLSKVVGLGALSISLAVAPLAIPASAQDATTNAPAIDAPVPDAEDVAEADRNFDWGWLGLLGLLGLAGLTGRREEPVRYREPEATTRTTYRE